MRLSRTVRAKQIRREREKAGLPVYDGGLGENPSPPPKEIIISIASHVNKHGYENAMGIDELQSVLGPRLVLGNGLKPLLATLQLAFAKLHPRGTIVHIVPMWLSYREQTTLLELSVTNVETKYKDDYRVTAADLEGTLSKLEGKPHLVLFNSPNNPTGYVYSSKEMKEFASVFEKYQSVVLHDYIYEHIIHPSCKDSGDLSKIYSKCIKGSSLSKNVSCGGYRFGWLIFPDMLEDLWRKCLEIASIQYTCPTTPLQYVACDILSADLTPYYRAQSVMFGDVTKLCAKALREMNLRVSEPEGAYYLLVDFAAYKDLLLEKGISDSDGLSEILCEEIGFITVPGCVFGIKEPYVVRYSIVDITEIDHSNGTYNIDRILAFHHELSKWLAL